MTIMKCALCKEDSDELKRVRVDSKVKSLCEECAEMAEEQDAIAQESESVVQSMMGFRGRR